MALKPSTAAQNEAERHDTSSSPIPWTSRAWLQELPLNTAAHPLVWLSLLTSAPPPITQNVEDAHETDDASNVAAPFGPNDPWLEIDVGIDHEAPLNVNASLLPSMATQKEEDTHDTETSSALGDASIRIGWLHEPPLNVTAFAC